jgi:hypothetical protein
MSDIFIIGISSPESDYKIVWLLNNFLEINLTQKEDFQADEKQSFSFFLFKKSEEFSFFLINNRSANAILSSKNKNLDFVFYIISDKNTQNLSKILKELNNIKEIRAAFEIKNDRVLEMIPNKISE